MNTSELLNAIVTQMVEKKGYAYTTGYLQSMLTQALNSDTLPKRERDANRSDLQYTLDRLSKDTSTYNPL